RPAGAAQGDAQGRGQQVTPLRRDRDPLVRKPTRQRGWAFVVHPWGTFPTCLVRVTLPGRGALETCPTGAALFRCVSRRGAGSLNGMKTTLLSLAGLV